MELFKASEQWSQRPADERFSTIAEMNQVCNDYRVKSTTGHHNTSQMHVSVLRDNEKHKTELVVNLDDEPTKFTHFGFNQLCHRLEAPPDYIRGLGKVNPNLAAECLNTGLGNLEHEEVQSLIYRPYEDSYGKLCRSMMTPSYKRIWNGEITNKLLGLLDYGWRVPPARPAFPGQTGTRQATLDDVLNDAKFSLSIKVGDLIAPAGLYVSDHDMFVFLVNPEIYIEDNGQPMYRGFFLWNSEVGSATLGIQTFLYRHVCSNHIVWGAANVKTLKIKHIGIAKALFETEFQTRLLEYTQSTAFPDIELIKSARTKLLGKDKEEVIETVLSQKKKITVGKRMLEDAYDEAEICSDEDGAPNSVWGLVQGLTRVSQISKYADARVKVDQEAGKILALAA